MTGPLPSSPPETRAEAFSWLDASIPNMARFYDALLCGKDNFAADRALADEVSMLVPAVPRLLHHNRRFLIQSVQRMAAHGMTQFLDLGCGLPVADNTHQAAQRSNPKARTVYVDRDPTVITHGRACLADDAQTVVVQADVRDHDAVLGADETRAVLDLSRPVGVVLTAVLHHIGDEDDPHGVVGGYMARLPPGSMLALSHFQAPGTDGPLDDQARAAERLLLAGLGSGWFRRPSAIAAFFDTLSLNEHGIRPLDGSCLALCGLARKP